MTPIRSNIKIVFRFVSRCADGRSEFEFQPSNRVSLPKVDLPDGYWQFERTVVFKMHGSISPAKRELDSFVITEEDYIGFLSRFSQSSAIPSQFLTYFRQCSFLFLGYGLADWNLRVVLNNLRSYLPESEGGKSWAIQRDVSLLESTLWAKRGVNLYELDLDQFTSRLGRGCSNMTNGESSIECPYVGLRPFTKAHRKYFHGRAKDIQLISYNLIGTHLTILYGASGVGKSSVLQAGVLPRSRGSPRYRFRILAALAGRRLHSSGQERNA